MKDFDSHFDTPADSLNESQSQELDSLIERIRSVDFMDASESIISDIIGGGLGFVIGPSIGKKIANALGITGGILYDLFTSKLVNAAIGAALAKRA